MKLSRKLRRQSIRDKHLKKLKDAQTIAEEYLAEAMPAVINDNTDTVTGKVMILALWSLHLDFGFGKERMQKFVRSILDFSHTVIQEKLEIDEVAAAIEAECKFNLIDFCKDHIAANDKEFKARRDFLETYRFQRRITKADE